MRTCWGEGGGHFHLWGGGAFPSFFGGGGGGRGENIVLFQIKSWLLLYPYLGEVGDHFLHEGLHGCNVDDLELVQVDNVVCVHVLVQFPEHAQQGHIGLPGSLEIKRTNIILTKKGRKS